MGKETIYRCDLRGCKATRPFVSPTNHWFIIGKPSEQTDTIEGKGIVVMPFPTQDNDIHCMPEEDKMFCGEAHAMEYIAQQLWLFYNDSVMAPNPPVAPATTGVGSSGADKSFYCRYTHGPCDASFNTQKEREEHEEKHLKGEIDLYPQVPFSDHTAVERDQKDAFCMDVEDPGESHDRE